MPRRSPGCIGACKDDAARVQPKRRKQLLIHVPLTWCGMLIIHAPALRRGGGPEIDDGWCRLASLMHIVAVARIVKSNATKHWKSTDIMHIRISYTTRSPECGGMNQIVNCYNKDTKLYWNANYMLKSLDLLSSNKFLSSLSALIKIRVGQLASRECWGIYTKNWRRRYSHQFWTWPVRYSFFMIYISTTFGFDQYSVWILKIHKLRGQCVNVNVSYGWFLIGNWRFRVFSDSN